MKFQVVVCLYGNNKLTTSIMQQPQNPCVLSAVKPLNITWAPLYGPIKSDSFISDDFKLPKAVITDKITSNEFGSILFPTSCITLDHREMTTNTHNNHPRAFIHFCKFLQKSKESDDIIKNFNKLKIKT